jgi:hypothetical protein
MKVNLLCFGGTISLSFASRWQQIFRRNIWKREFGVQITRNFICRTEEVIGQQNGGLVGWKKALNTV